MRRVQIFQFEVYDVISDQMKKSRRWGTRDAIERIANGRVLEETVIEVDESVVASDVQGLTVIGFMPAAREGFQDRVF